MSKQLLQAFYLVNKRTAYTFESLQLSSNLSDLYSESGNGDTKFSLSKLIAPFSNYNQIY